MDTHLTRRGRALAVVLVSCLALGAMFGARSLNAIVAPGVIALLAGVLVVHRASAPSIERTVPPDGHPDERHAVDLAIDGCSTGNYEIDDRLDRQLDGPQAASYVTERRQTLTYDVTYERRGVASPGPASITVTDALGLASKAFDVDAGDESILVYPTLVSPSAAVRSTLETAVDLERRPGREEFDRLREYVRGDSLRDVHWKSSAKQPDDDLVVKEFLGTTPTDAVGIAVAPAGDRQSLDAAARAAASITVTLVDEGIDVGVETPAETVPAAAGPAQHEAILAALARLRPGTVGADDAPITVTANDGEALVHAAGRTVPFRPANPDPSGDGSADQPGSVGDASETASAPGTASDRTEVRS